MVFNRKTAVFLAIILIMILSGCTVQDEITVKRKKVTEAQVKAFQNQKTQKRVDIYVPIMEQYTTSSHTESLKTLRKYKGAIEPRCYQCMSAEYFLAPANNKPDPSSLKESITCAVCHEMTVSEFKLRLDPLETCTSCHNNGEEIIPGNKVHHPQKEMFLGYGAIGVPVTPDSKYRSGLTCIECHMPNEAHTFIGKTPADALKEHTESICVMCHADQSEEQFALEVSRMQKQINDNCQAIMKQLNTSRQKIDNLKAQGVNVTTAEQVYNIIYTNMSFIEEDKSKGIHNFDYSTKIIDYTKKRKAELDSLLK